MRQRKNTSRARVIVLLAALAAACDPKDDPALDPSFVPPEITTPLTILPSPVSLRVGKNVQLTASSRGSAAPDRAVRWTSSSTAIASVGEFTGVVECLAAGSVTITATPSGFAGIAPGTGAVTCNPFFTLPADALLFSHRVGTSPCPQPAGTIRVTNTSDETLTVVVQSTNASIQTDVSFLTLAAGTSRDVQVVFNCGTQVSFRSAITFSAVLGSITENKQTEVVATIIR